MTVVLVVGIAGCGEAAIATQASRPEKPPDWLTIVSEAGDVRLVVPPDFAAVTVEPVVVAQGGSPDEMDSWIEIDVQAPADVEQPNGVDIEDWLDGYLTLMAGSGSTGDETRRELLLPAGRALEIGRTFEPGTDVAGRIVIYAIETESGYAVLRIAGTPGGIADRAADLELVTHLVDFNGAGASE
jgi:hypothetical protein